MKRQISIILILLLLLGGCSLKVSEKPKEIKVGGLFALTGDGASWGIDEMQAVQLAFDEINTRGGINKRPVKLVIEDTQTVPRVAVTAMRKLIDVDNVQIVIGATWDESVGAIAPIVEDEKVALISPSISGATEDEKKYDYLFTTWYSDVSSVKALLRFMAHNDHNRIAVVYNLNLWSQFFRNTLTKNAPNFGVDIVEEFAFSDDTTDFRTIIIKLKELNIDAVFFAFTSDESMQPFIKQARELQLSVPMYSGSQTENEKTTEWYGSYKPGVYHTYPKTGERIEEFNRKFKDKYGREPTSPSAATAYDAARLVIAALAEGKTTGPEIKDWLVSVKDFPGIVIPKINFDSLGLIDAGPDAFAVKTVVDDKFVEV